MHVHHIRLPKKYCYELCSPKVYVLTKFFINLIQKLFFYFLSFFIDQYLCSLYILNFEDFRCSVLLNFCSDVASFIYNNTQTWIPGEIFDRKKNKKKRHYGFETESRTCNGNIFLQKRALTQSYRVIMISRCYVCHSLSYVKTSI